MTAREIGVFYWGHPVFCVDVLLIRLFVWMSFLFVFLIRLSFLFALAHKLIRVIYTLLKKRQPYIDPDTDYEGLMVMKNAPRWLRRLDEYGYLDQIR